MNNTTYCFTNARVYRDGVFTNEDVICSGGRIERIVPRGSEKGPEQIDCGGRMLVPGFLDMHTHGANGVDVNAADAEGIRTIGRFFAQHGTTGWNASVLTDTPQQTLRAIDAVCAAMDQPGEDCAPPLGVHLEGPFLAAAYKGAMPEHLLQPGSEALYREYQAAAGGRVRYMTVSPEVSGVNEMIAAIAGEVTVGIGHSGADYNTAMQAVNNGARCATHTGNAMRLLHQHEPAIFGAVLESDVWCEAICDGLHLHPGTVRLLLKCKGPQRVIAVTDSIMAAGLPDGRYRLGVNDVVVKNGDARLVEPDVRAGSTLTMDRALKNLVRFTGLPVEAVLPLMTANPADCLRLADRKGRIAPGLDADFVLLDEELNVCATYLGGRCLYRG